METVLFVEYPKCSTCKRQKSGLMNMASPIPIGTLLKTIKLKRVKELARKSGLPLRRFFNTSGMLYRELGVKKRFEDGMTDERLLSYSLKRHVGKAPL